MSVLRSPFAVSWFFLADDAAVYVDVSTGFYSGSLHETTDYDIPCGCDFHSCLDVTRNVDGAREVQIPR